MGSPLMVCLLATFVLHSRAKDTDPSLKAGPCPKPAAAPNYNAARIVGRWLDTYTTYEVVTAANQRRCAQNFIELDSQDGSLYVNSTFKEGTGSDISVLRKKFVPVADQPGKYITQVIVDGNWQNHGWEYTFEAFEDDSFIEFGCRKIGDKHREFHRIRSRRVPVPESVVDKLLAVARADGDDRPALKYNQEGCNYGER